MERENTVFRLDQHSKPERPLDLHDTMFTPRLVHDPTTDENHAQQDEMMEDEYLADVLAEALDNHDDDAAMQFLSPQPMHDHPVDQELSNALEDAFDEIGDDSDGEGIDMEDEL